MSGRSGEVLDRSEALERVSDGVVSFDAELRYTYLNERAESLIDEDAEDLEGEYVFDVFPETEGTVVEESFDRALETGERVTYERYNEELERWFEVRVYPGEEGLSLFFTDITERKERERELQRYERIVENLPVAVAHSELDSDGFAYVNPRLVEMFGAGSKAEMEQYHPDDFYADAEARERLRELLRENGRIERREVDLETVDGERFRASVTASLEEVDDRHNYVGIIEDVTEREERERRLRRAETLFENAQDALFLVDVEDDGDGDGRRYRLQRVNPAYERITGLSNERLAGRTIREVFDGDAAAIRERYGECVDRREPIEYEERLAVPEPDSYWETRIAPVVVDGEVVQLVGATRNITDRKEREEELRRVKRRLDLAIEAAGVGTWDWNVETGEVVFNDEWAEMLGASLEEIDDDPDAWRDRLHPDDAEEAIEELKAHVKGATDRYDHEVRLRTADGGYKWVRTIGKVVDRDEDGTARRAVGIHVDVDDRKRVERQLRETTTIMESIVESSPDAVVMVDEDREVTLWNRAAEEMFGWTEDEVLGREAPFVPEEKADEFETFIEDLDAGDVKRGVQTVRKTKDGDRIDVSLSSAKVELDGELVGYMGTFEDVTQRRAYERRLERQRDDLEVLTRMVSHDIRNDLEVVLGYAELLERRSDDEGRDYARQVIEKARAAVELTQTASSLTEAMLQSERTREPIPLRSTLETQVEETRATYDAASVTLDGSTTGVSVMADEMLSSVFRNLLKNAVQHNDEDVPVVNVSVEASEETVTVRVADNGPGIPDDRKEEVFGRGEKGLDSEGTGIGLYLVRTLVEQYGGRVSVEDNDPEGAVFVVELDRA